MTHLSRHAVSIAALLHVAALGCSGAQPAPAKEEPTPKTDQPGAGSQPGAGAGASWVDSQVARIRVDHGEDGGMRGCTGALTPEAKTHFAKVYTEAKECFSAGASAPGQAVTFHSTLEEGGGLSEFSVLSGDQASPEVIECIQGKAMSIEYPKVDPATPCVQLVHPLTYP